MMAHGSKVFPGGSVLRNLTADAEDWVQSLGQEDPLEREWQPLQYSCLGNPMDTGAGRLQSTGPKTAGHNVVTKTATRQDGGNPRGRVASTPP